MSSTVRAGMALAVASIVCASAALTAGIASYSHRTDRPRAQVAAACGAALFRSVRPDCAIPAEPRPVVIAALAAAASPAEPARIESPALDPPAEPPPVLAERSPAPRVEEAPPEIPSGDAVPPAPAPPSRPARVGKVYVPINAPRAADSVKPLDAPLAEASDGAARAVRVIPIDGIVAGTEIPAPPEAQANAQSRIDEITRLAAAEAIAAASRAEAPARATSRDRARSSRSAVGEEAEPQRSVRARRAGRRSYAQRSYRSRRYSRGDDYERSGRRSRRQYVEEGAAPQPPASLSQPSPQRVYYRRAGGSNLFGWLGGSAEN